MLQLGKLTYFISKIIICCIQSENRILIFKLFHKESSTDQTINAVGARVEVK
jgi:hypothetical protein